MGIPAPSRPVWAGRAPPRVSSMLAESMPTKAAASSTKRFDCLPGEKGMIRGSIFLGPPEAVPTRVEPRDPGPWAVGHVPRSTSRQTCISDSCPEEKGPQTAACSVSWASRLHQGSPRGCNDRNKQTKRWAELAMLNPHPGLVHAVMIYLERQTESGPKSVERGSALRDEHHVGSPDPGPSRRSSSQERSAKR